MPTFSAEVLTQIAQTLLKVWGHRRVVPSWLVVRW